MLNNLLNWLTSPLLESVPALSSLPVGARGVLVLSPYIDSSLF